MIRKLQSIPAAMGMLFALGSVLHLTACKAKKPEDAVKEKPFARAAEGKKLFEEKCRTVAGEKIYRKVENVEGVLLLNTRQKGGAKEWADPMWPGAAFAHESPTGEKGFVKTFLWYESYSIRDGKKVANKLGLTTAKTDLPGYRFVDVVDASDKKRYRYTGRWEEPWRYDKSYRQGYIKFFLDRIEANAPVPRYAVALEDVVNPAERVFGIASGKVKVIDTQTNETLGELVRYVWSPGGESNANPSPWLSAYACGGHSSHYVTRFFVDQVLIPKKEN